MKPLLIRLTRVRCVTYLAGIGIDYERLESSGDLPLMLPRISPEWPIRQAR